MDRLGDIESGGSRGMKTRTGGRLWSNIARWFPERQIYHRAEGKVSYMTVSTGVQVASVGGLVVLAGWLAFASASFALRGHAIDIRAEASQTKLARYERLLQEARSREASALALLESRTQEFRTIADDFESRHEALKALLGGAAAELETASAGTTARTIPAALAGAGGASQVAMLRRDTTEQPAAVRLSALRAEQERMMAVAASAAETRITAAREAIELAGLDVADLVDGAEGVGGPLVELDLSEIAPDVDTDEAFNDRIAVVAQRVAEADELERAIDSAPFRAPVAADYRLTSRFGGRVDPFTKKSAYHTGLDLGAYYRAPVVTTAKGVVSFAGWKGGYGRTIEIDHGNGFKTRYGHLSQIDIKVGDTVAAGDRIGSMGSTGRSTGTHLHYEVWFKGKVQDPAKYLKAGRHVQQS